MYDTSVAEAIAAAGMAAVFITLIISLTVSSAIKAKYRSEGQWGKDGNIEVPPMFEKMFEKAISARDAKILKMEKRIQVLEKIVTDTHGSSTLAAEIDKL